MVARPCLHRLQHDGKTPRSTWQVSPNTCVLLQQHEGKQELHSADRECDRVWGGVGEKGAGSSMDTCFNPDGSTMFGLTLLTCQGFHCVLEGPRDSMDCPFCFEFFCWCTVLQSGDECWRLLLDEEPSPNHAHSKRCTLNALSAETVKCRRWECPHLFTFLHKLTLRLTTWRRTRRCTLSSSILAWLRAARTEGPEVRQRMVAYLLWRLIRVSSTARPGLPRCVTKSLVQIGRKCITSAYQLS